MSEGVLSFHMPGHQQGKGAPPRFREFLERHALAADLTQVLGLDDVHRPLGVTGQAQRLAAEAYGADETFFLVNGSTCGNQAMILAALRPGDEVVLPRNVHRSVLGALVLADARPVFVPPPVDDEMGVAHCVTPESVRQALDEHPAAAALLFTSPTYHGAAADVEALVALGHGRGLPVLVDEAWGPHLPFHEALPTSALRAGADLVVTSTHKLLAGLSQAAMLHFQGDRVDRGRVETAVRLFQSTSPNCLLVASLDAARHQVATRGRELLDRALRLARGARRELDGIPGVRCYGEDRAGRPGVHAWDPTRLVISVEGYSGCEVERLLRADHGLQVEMSDLVTVVALVTLGHDEADLRRLVDSFRALPRRPAHRRVLPSLPPVPEIRLSPRQAFDAPWETVPLDSAPGRVAAEMVTPYPPGIPLLCPGEVISPGAVEFLGRALDVGIPIQGPFDPTLATLRVVRTSRPDRGES